MNMAIIKNNAFATPNGCAAPWQWFESPSDDSLLRNASYPEDANHILSVSPHLSIHVNTDSYLNFGVICLQDAAT